MSERDNGGPAFPREDYQTSDAPGQQGMTLRDYFAAKAMQAMVSKWGWDGELIKQAFSCADAMLRERDR